MSDAVTIELIRATAIIIPTAISAFAALMASRAARNSKELAVKVNGLLHEQLKAATDLGHAEGKAVGVEEERNRT